MSSQAPAVLSLIWKDPDTQQERAFALAPALRIGSHPDLNDLVLSFPGVNPLHGELSMGAKGEWELVGMGTSTFEANGAQVRRVTLEKDTRLKIGSLEVTVGIPGERKAPVHAPSPRPVERPQPRPVPKPQTAKAASTPGGSRQALVSVGLGLGGAVLLAGAALLAFTMTKKPAPPPAPTPEPAPSPTPDPFAPALRALVTVSGTRSTGEPLSTLGLVLDGHGRLVASLRAVKDASGLAASLGGAPPVPLRLLGRDEPRDLALLEGTFEPPAPMARFGSSTGLAAGARLAVGTGAGLPVVPDAYRATLPAGDETPSLLQREGTAVGVLLDGTGLVVGFVTPSHPAGTAIPVEDLAALLGTAPPPPTPVPTSPAAPAAASTAAAPAAARTP
jgi:hypothetical protein